MSPLTPNTPGVSSFNREVDAFLDKREERLKRHRGARFYCVWATVMWAATMAALGAFFSAGALAVLHWSSMKHGGSH